MTNHEVNPAPIKPADELIADMGRLTRQINPDVARLAIQPDVEQAMARFSASGVDLAPAGARQKITDEFYRRYDEATTADVLAFDEAYRVTVADLERRLAESRQAPALNLSDAKTATALLAWRTLLAGATLEDVRREYESSRDPVLEHVVERRDVARVFSLAADDRDSVEVARSVRALQDAVAARQDARQDARLANELKTLLARREANFALGHAIREARNARGAAITIARRSHTEALPA
jgi:hypothetical protein